MKSLGLSFLLLILLPFIVEAQKWEAGILLGASNYSGDLVPTRVPTMEENQFSQGIILRYHFNNQWAIRANLLRAKISGSDMNFVEEGRAPRGYVFESPITEASLNVEWDILGKLRFDNEGNFKKIFTPFLYAGVGNAFYSPTVDFNEGDAGSSMQAKIAQDKAELTKSGIVFPFGGGLKYDLSKSLSIGIEAGARATLTDYLDGVSQAGNPDANDWYFYGGITISGRFGGLPKSVDAKDMSEEEGEKSLDTDGDGIADIDDKCPILKGNAAFSGCPDTDNDGIADIEDDCPDMAGLKTTKGCPDTDNDGLIDKEDKCPDVAGVLNGCPDADNDGLADNEDNCPEEAGAADNGGCPIKVVDSDNDGVNDDLDKCPTLAGSSALGGCPDSDGDGIVDIEDDCPTQAGAAGSNGCPKVVATAPADSGYSANNSSSYTSTSTRSSTSSGNIAPGQPVLKTEVTMLLERAREDIKFDLESPDIETTSYPLLDQIADLMRIHPNYFLTIKGFADSSGEEDVNTQLSMRRARRCFRYLAEQGVSPRKMKFVGLGEANPIGDNSTQEGRRKNRRVEFEITTE